MHGAKAPRSIADRMEPCPGFDAKLKKARALMGGTEAMRRAGDKYLPQYEGESTINYDRRRDMSYLFPGFRKAVQDFSGRVFHRPTELPKDAPEPFRSWAEDVDLEGRNLNVFASQLFEAGMQSGIEYILVDAPPAVAGETRADAMRANRRPYLVHLRPERVLGWKTARIDNETVLTQIRFEEYAEEPADEFKDEMVKQIRVLDRLENGVMARVFRLDEKSGDWLQWGNETMTGLPEITIAPFYAQRVDYMKGMPPLDDLADLNVAHWQSQSDQRNILRWSRVPILFAKGIEEDSKFRVSASSLTTATDPGADLRYVEHSGAAIAAGQTDIEHLEFQMQVIGLQFVAQMQGPNTATGEIMHAMKETSRLTMIAASLQRALQRAFEWMGEYDNQPFGGEVHVHMDFTAGAASTQTLTWLLEAVKSGQISKQTFWAEIRRFGMLAEDFDPEVELAVLEQESASLGGMIPVMGEEAEGAEDDE